MQVQLPVGEAELLAQFHATKALKKSGFTDEQLSLIRFSQKYRTELIDDWPLLLPNTEVRGNNILQLARQVALYRYALIEGPNEVGNQVARAFELCGLAEIAPLIEQGRNHGASQKKKAQKERGFVDELDTTMKKFVTAFHRKPGMRNLTMKERWNEFLGTLRAARLNVKDRGDVYAYRYREKAEDEENYKTISYRTFKSHCSKDHRPT